MLVCPEETTVASLKPLRLWAAAVSCCWSRNWFGSNRVTSLDYG